MHSLVVFSSGEGPEGPTTQAEPLEGSVPTHRMRPVRGANNQRQSKRTILLGMQTGGSLPKNHPVAVHRYLFEGVRHGPAANQRNCRGPARGGPQEPTQIPTAGSDKSPVPKLCPWSRQGCVLNFLRGARMTGNIPCLSRITEPFYQECDFCKQRKSELKGFVVRTLWVRSREGKCKRSGFRKRTSPLRGGTSPVS